MPKVFHNHVGRGERTQTFDLSVPNRARYQLRHTPMVRVSRIVTTRVVYNTFEGNTSLLTVLSHNSEGHESIALTPPFALSW